MNPQLISAFASMTSTYNFGSAVKDEVSILIITAIILGLSTIAFFGKVGKAKWTGFVPIYGPWQLLTLGGQAGFWSVVTVIIGLTKSDKGDSGVGAAVTLIVGLVSIIALVVYIRSLITISRSFGKSSWYSLLLLILPFVGYPILGYGPSQYRSLKKSK